MDKPLKKLRKGRFYGHLDQSKRLHPNLILETDDENNTYVSASFTHSSSKAIRLPNNIDPEDEEPCYVRKKLVVDKRNKYTVNQLKGLRLTPKNREIVNEIYKEYKNGGKNEKN